VALVHSLRGMNLRKSPSISETLDWARALVTLNAASLDPKMLETTLSVLLKHETDLQQARRHLQRFDFPAGGAPVTNPRPGKLPPGKLPNG
jgi:hypothetical protein